MIQGIKLKQLFWIFLFISFLLVIKNYTLPNKTKKINKKPVISWWTTGFPGIQETVDCGSEIVCDITDSKKGEREKADAFMFYGSNIDFKDLPKVRNPDTIWGLYHEESPRNVGELSHEHFLNLFNYSATFSRHSDVPFPLEHLHHFDDITTTEFFVETKDKNKLLDDIAPVLFLQTDCDTATEREKYVKELMKLVKIDSYGSCLNNKEIPKTFKEDYLNRLNEEKFLRFVARYKFVIAIENGVCDDYITEKFWRAIKVGSVPIYFGSPTIRDWLPNENSAILLSDYPTPEVLKKRLDELLKNDLLYEKYLEHKIEKVISNKKLIQEYERDSKQSEALTIVSKFNCLICNRLHQQLNGSLQRRIVTQKHYDCPKPISATLTVNPKNTWLFTWYWSKNNSRNIYNKYLRP